MAAQRWRWRAGAEDGRVRDAGSYAEEADGVGAGGERRGVRRAEGQGGGRRRLSAGIVYPVRLFEMPLLGVCLAVGEGGGCGDGDGSGGGSGGGGWYKLLVNVGEPEGFVAMLSIVPSICVFSHDT